VLTKEIEKSINESILCWLATVDEDGVPNNSPKEVFLSNGANELLIADIASPNSVKNIKHNPNVCVSFVHVFKQKGFKLKGVANYYKKYDSGYNELFQHVYQMTGDKYPVNGIIRITVNEVKPILAPSYFLFPDVTENEQIEIAHKTYGVLPTN